jgi:hypothetical protein
LDNVDGSGMVSYLEGGGLFTTKDKDSEARAILDSFKSPYLRKDAYGELGDYGGIHGNMMSG